MVAGRFPPLGCVQLTSGVGGMGKCVEHTEANSNRLSSEKMLGRVSRGGAVEKLDRRERGGLPPNLGS